MIGAVGLSEAAQAQAGGNLPPNVPEWMTYPGDDTAHNPYGLPSRYEGGVARKVLGTPKTLISASSRTPLQDLDGIITPNGLHYERHHAGIPEIDPAQHRLMIFGLVDRPLVLKMDDLKRFPSVSRIHMMECSGNQSFSSTGRNTAQEIMGLVSCAEWTGVALRTVLEECGVQSNASWVVAEGADAAAMTRSIPLEKCLDDVILAYSQNGERIRPEQGYPLRIFDLAPHYWQKGLSALPVQSGSKQPAVQQWTSYQSNLPNKSRRQDWIDRFSASGMGINTGTEILPDEMLVAIDVDDDKLVRFVSQLLGNPCCAKRGKKGLTYFCRAHKSENIKATTFKGTRELGNIDILGGGRFTVLPPTIHPDTGMPYTWESASLLDVDFTSLPQIDKRRLGLVEKTIASENAAVLTTGQTTHDSGLVLVGMLVREGAADEEILAIVNGLLPAHYVGNSLDELPEWIASAREKGYGDCNTNQKYDPGDLGPIPLGFTKDGSYAFRDQVRGIILLLSASQLLNMQTLIGLAPSDFWREMYPGKSSPFSAWVAGEALLGCCRKKGPFDPAKVRGRGVWKEGDGIFANLGQDLPPDSQHQYLSFSSISVMAAETFDVEGLQKLFRCFPFKDPNNADLLLGWLCVAPLCGALDWRPHGFLFGPPNSGKTTFHNLLGRLLGPMSVAADGQSSEAGIRQVLGPDALPVIIDEFETDSHRGRLQGVMRLVRSASSAESPLLRGTPEGKAMQFSIRTMVLLSAVNVTAMSPADQSRFIVVELKAHENDPEISAHILRATDQFGNLGREWCGYMIGLAPQVLESIETLKAAMLTIDSRLRQTMATLLSGLFVALHRRAPNDEEAETFIRQYHGTILSHAQDQDRDNAGECLEHLLSHVVRNAEGLEYSLGHWIASDLAGKKAGCKANILPDSTRILELYQIKIYLGEDVKGFLIRNGAPPINKVFQGTKWADGAWQRALRQLQGAFKLESPQRFAGIYGKHRSVGLPLEYVPESDEGPHLETQF